MRWRPGITLKLSLVFGLFATVLLAAVIWYSSARGSQALQAATMADLVSTALEKESALNAWVADRIADLRVLAGGPRLAADMRAVLGQGRAAREDYDRVVTHLSARIRASDHFISLLVMEPEAGRVVAATDPDEEGTYRKNRPYFVQGLGGPHVQGPYHSLRLRGVAMTVATPLRAPDGRVMAVAAARLNLGELGEIVTRRSGLQRTDDAFLVNRENQFVTQPRLLQDPAVLRRGIRTPHVNRCLGGESGSVMADDYRGVPVLAAYRWIPERQLCLVAKMDQADALMPVVALRRTLFLFGGGVLGAALVLALGLGRAITRPVRQLTAAAISFGRGELGARLAEGSSDELGLLAREFNTMAAALSDRERQLREAAADLRTANLGLEDQARILDALVRAGMAVASSLEMERVLSTVVESATRLVDGRSAALRLLTPEGRLEMAAAQRLSDEYLRQGAVDISGSSVAGRVLAERRTVAVEDIGLHPELPLQAALLQEGIGAMVTVPLAVGERSLGVLTVHKAARDSFSAREQVALRLLADQTALAIERSRLFKETEASAARLAESNRELEAFSYSVSHDLRAPLRALDGFSRILLERHAAGMPQEAQRYLHMVRDNAVQMGRLVDDLLRFSRLGRQPLETRIVATADMVRQVLDHLAGERKDRQVKVSVGDLPPCQADPALLRQVFTNLIENAFKFTRRREVAEVEVGSREVCGERAYFVRDNGAGFDMRYAHKLFGVFQRLHRADEFEGTGVGLAIVQRIVHRHGGRVWAEAEVDRGATFHFTLERGSSHDG